MTRGLVNRGVTLSSRKPIAEVRGATWKWRVYVVLVVAGLVLFNTLFLMKSLTSVWRGTLRHEGCLTERVQAITDHSPKSETENIFGVVCHIRTYAAGSVFPEVLRGMMDRLIEPLLGKSEAPLTKRLNTQSFPVYTFDLAYNPNRKSKRKTSAWKASPSMSEEFDQYKFNFHHADPLELVMYFEPYSGDTASRTPDCRCESKQDLVRRKHAVFLNRFPLGPHSGILAPHFKRNHSQNLADVWGRESLHIGLRFAATTAISPNELEPHTNSQFRVGFNSLAAGASVNHLHFQFWEYAGAGPGGMPIELAFQNSLAKGTGFRLLARHTSSRCRFREIQGGDYPLTGFVIEGGVRSCRAAAAEVLHIAIRWLTSHETPYNLLFNGDDAYIIPRAATSEFTMIGGTLPPGFPEVFGEIICIEEDCMKMSPEQLSKHFVERLNVPLEEVIQPMRSAVLNEIGKTWELQSGMYHLNIAT